MSSHRRYVESDTYPDLVGGLLPEQPLQPYGVVRLGAHPNYGIATNLREEQKDPSASGFVDWLFGGFEEEDVAASPTAAGIDPRTGKPVAPEAAQIVADDMNKARENLWDNVVNFYTGGDDADKSKGPNWKNIGLTLGAIGGGYLLWSKVIQPKLAQRKAGQ